MGRDPVTGHPRQISRTVVGGKRLAQRALTEMLHEVDRGAQQGTSANFGYLLDEWLVHQRRKGRAPATMVTYEAHIAKRIRPALGGIALSKLSAHDLDRYYAALTDAGLAPATVRVHHSIISGALSQAVRWGWVNLNVARSAEAPAREARQSPIPDAEAVRSLLAAALAEDADMGIALILAVLTGARRGELCGLRWSDLDATTGVLSIERSWSDIGPGGTLSAPKSGKPRQVVLGRDGLAALAAYRARVDERAVRLGVTVEDDGWLISYDCGTTHFDPPGLTAYVTALGKRLGIPIHLHQLRHFSATQLLAGGVDVRTVAERLGHQDGGALLLRVYAHPVAERDREAAEMIGRVLAGDPTQVQPKDHETFPSNPRQS